MTAIPTLWTLVGGSMALGTAPLCPLRRVLGDVALPSDKIFSLSQPFRLPADLLATPARRANNP